MLGLGPVLVLVPARRIEDEDDDDHEEDVDDSRKLPSAITLRL